MDLTLEIPHHDFYEICLKGRSEHSTAEPSTGEKTWMRLDGASTRGWCPSTYLRWLILGVLLICDLDTQYQTPPA